MARNQEKANVRSLIFQFLHISRFPESCLVAIFGCFQAMLNRFLKAKEDEAKGPVKKRPYLASECEDLGECEKWRGQIIREIGRKVAEIQNGICRIFVAFASLHFLVISFMQINSYHCAGMIGEHKIRDLNDEINKLLREKGHWEKQILKLGGADHAVRVVFPFY